MRIVVVEDDYWQSEWICMELARVFKTSPEKVFTEYEFQEQFNSYIESPPDVVILDVMLPWTKTQAETGDRPPRPPKVKEEGPYRAGLRCKDLLTDTKETAKTLIVLYTVLDRNDLESQLEGLPANVLFLPKGQDAISLVEEIRRIPSLSSK